MSLAPLSTAPRRRAMRSITSHNIGNKEALLNPGFGRCTPRVRQLPSDAARNARNEAQRRTSEAASLVRMPDIAAQQPADDAEHARRARGPEAQRGMAI